MDYTGQLLIARPRNNDRFFKRSVILVYESNRAGTIGVILNRKTNHTCQNLLSLTLIRGRAWRFAITVLATSAQYQ